MIRFSTVAGERGSPDTWRDPRGFAVKFYTSEGNLDIVGNNTPVFFIRDPIKFQNFIRSQKRLAANNLRDPDMQWDFWTLSPESAHQVTYLMGDRGIPRSWRHMNGYSSHTYMWVNEAGERFWVKYHFKTEQGIENLTQAEADRIAGEDADYHQRDLYDAIAQGDFPRWSLKMQIMPFDEAKTYRFNPFDLTKIWPHQDYPLIDVGTMTLDRNVTDYHAQMEQAAFQPNNTVPGTGLSPDKMLLARGFSYADAHRARLGVNYQQIPVNRPKSPVRSYSKDGAMRIDNVSDPVYYPNSFADAPAADSEHLSPSTPSGPPTARWCGPPTPSTPRTTTSAKPGPCSPRSWTTPPASASSTRCRTTWPSCNATRCSGGPSSTGATSTRPSAIRSRRPPSSSAGVRTDATLRTTPEPRRPCAGPRARVRQESTHARADRMAGPDDARRTLSPGPWCRSRSKRGTPCEPGPRS